MVDPRRQSVVFIDMDHTLLEGPFESAVFPQVLGEIAQETGLEVEELLRKARSENLARQANPAVSPVQAMDWDDILAGLATGLGVKLTVNALEIVQAHPGPPSAALHPGAFEALQSLASAKPGRALVLATKGLRKYQLPILEALGILPFFDGILTPDDSQALKGSLSFYGEWPRKTQVQIMVGDTYTEDVVPALGFGFKTVWRVRANPGMPETGDPFTRPAEPGVCPADQPFRPDAVIYSLFELPAVVERLEQS